MQIHTVKRELRQWAYVAILSMTVAFTTFHPAIAKANPHEENSDSAWGACLATQNENPRDKNAGCQSKAESLRLESWQHSVSPGFTMQPIPFLTENPNESRRSPAIQSE